MATGDSNDIVTRVKRVIPWRWWSYVAPLRDAVIGGLADGAAWGFAWIAYARLQSRIATATGPFLDLIAYDFLGRHLARNGALDDSFRARIKATILQERVTRAGMSAALTTLTGAAPVIFEPWNTGDTGGWDGPTLGFDAGGAWGDTGLIAQDFIAVIRPGLEGIPGISGWDNGGGGWDVGALEWTDPSMIVAAVSDHDIYETVNVTRPTGTISWVALASAPSVVTAPSLAFENVANTQYFPLIG